MVINWKEYNDKDHILAWLLLEFISYEGIEKFGDFKSEKLDVLMEINGVPIDIIPTIDFLQKQIDENIEIHEKLKNKIQKITKILVE